MLFGKIKRLLLLIIFILVAIYSYTQVDYSYDSKLKNGEEFVVLTFKNTTSEYVHKEVTVSYMYYDGKFYHPYKKVFKLSMSPNETYKGTLSYTTRDNNMIIKKKEGKMELKKFEVTFD